MWHWRCSSAAGMILTGRYRPLCAWVYGLPDSAFRRAFLRGADRWFAETDHCARIARTYALCRAVRGYAPPPITGRTRARATGY